jgi:serine/threonine protein kinase
MTDFGYSCYGANDDDIVRLPYSRPWAAPEYHSRDFTLRDAKRMDVYSFGMLCLYILFQKRLEDSTSSLVSYLEDLKASESLLDFTHDMVSRFAAVGETQKTSLKEFFDLTLSHKPYSRNMDFKTLINRLGGQR